MKAARNKTINIKLEEGAAYLERCIRVSGPVSLEFVTDKTITGDCLDVLPYLTDSFVDLLIADPPYNLDKNFNGSRFRNTYPSNFWDDISVPYWSLSSYMRKQLIRRAEPCLKFVWMQSR